MNYLKHNKVLLHIFGWLLIYVLVFSLFLSGSLTFGETLLKTGPILLTQCIIFYLNLYVFLPRFLERKKYILYAICVVILIAFFLWILQITQAFSSSRGSGINEIAMRRLREKPNGSILKSGRLILSGISMFGTLFISTILRNISESQRKDRERIALENKIVSAESRLLKSQLNPHFLFNSLNNIYALSSVQSKKTPESILRLSQLLSYVLYESEVQFVKLDQEIEYIKSFVELNLLKDESCNNVRTDFQDINRELMIAPLVLITFIENCFKHSYFENSMDNWIRLHVQTKGSKLYFEAVNSIPKINLKKDKTKGIGLENVKKRLELIYQNCHQLSIKNDGQVFEVKLEIELNEI